MKFKSLHLEGFQSYDKADIIFTDFKITFITGLNQDTGSSNGAGKSGIKEALFYLLFGRSKVKGPDLIRRGQKVLKVSGQIEHNSYVLDITRTRKAQTATLELVINGVPSIGTASELQTKIEQLLGIDIDSFTTYSVIDKVRQTDLTQLSSTDLRMVLQDLLGLNKLQEVLSSLNAHKNDLEKYLLRAHTRFYPSEKRLDALKDYQTLLQEKRDEYGTKVLDASSKKNALQHDIEALEVKNRELACNKNNLLRIAECPTCGAPISIDKRMVKLNVVEVEIADNKATIEKLTGEIPPLVSTITEYLNINTTLGVRITRCITRIAQLSESMKEQQDINVVKVEQETYVSALTVLQNYITSVLADVALKIEDQMNLELSRFSDLFCKINLSKTKLDGQIIPNCSITLYRDQYEYSFDMLSSGEQALVSLIFKLVISNLRGNVSMLFVDEGLDALDEVNRERILSLLEISPYTQIFIISHREDSNHIKAGQKILLRKTDGITQVISI
jgi:DNA repair exonuclease SbcCD ATPase subunit